MLVAAGAAAGLCAVGLGVPVPAGGAIMGFGFLFGSLIRVTLSERRAGALAVRSKRVDALTLAAFGAALVIGSLLMLLRLHDS
ncbi:hypothetical protein Mro02_58410 [Microbispora rosea subsp. aerata]|nr:hypothetical protein Mro02_58410 [Microbispora rosea subsp. aerata]GLJ85886.1 hypothetical protein GCM10017588_46190 [Microbispora rosea subsp. aerata]